MSEASPTSSWPSFRGLAGVLVMILPILALYKASGSASRNGAYTKSGVTHRLDNEAYTNGTSTANVVNTRVQTVWPGCQSKPKIIEELPPNVIEKLEETWTKFYALNGQRNASTIKASEDNSDKKTPSDDDDAPPVCEDDAQCLLLIERGITLNETASKFAFDRPDPSKGPLRNIGYIKTHKTASSTVGGIMSRFAARHCCRMYLPDGNYNHFYKINKKIPNQDKGKINIMNQHITGRFIPDQNWTAIKAFYNTALAPNHTMISIVRHPLHRYLSYYAYMLEPQEVSFEEFIKTKEQKDGLCEEFGLRSLAEVRGFIAKMGDNFGLMLITDRLDESLVAMSLKFNWRLWDITEVPLLDSSSYLGSVRFDGRLIKPTKTVNDLTESQLRTIKKLIVMDELLYDAANKALDREIAALGPAFDKALNRYRVLQPLLHKMCDPISSMKITRRVKYEFREAANRNMYRQLESFCHWYSLPDYAYELFILPDGYPKPMGPDYFL